MEAPWVIVIELALPLLALKRIARTFMPLPEADAPLAPVSVVRSIVPAPAVSALVKKAHTEARVRRRRV